ncbi:5-(carboxyamino)imidazole ribonucleotide synthase [Peribacillus alkalitolerans]|uniref:5-(carboxyamino)imidazole ribonucleotide synthase n=1 Tax=Peribacillus alkalitolerans TaxID=1550385 RepID=UPI0013D8173E|nr:5-(carboxyamino)imidazole ribonucleotide synthase [Peribacillus alkalitolerans]
MNSLNKTILPGQTIGIVGGGQLGRMMALAAKAAGFKIAVLDPTPNCPCGQVADIEITAAYNDLEGLRLLADASDVITFEFENVDAVALEWLQTNCYVPQGSELLKITQNRIREKQEIEKAGAIVAPYAVITDVSEIYDTIEKLGYPSVLKTARGGYDGKGQLVIRDFGDIEKAKELLVQGVCVLESWVPFVKEISVIVSRNENGETAVFPVAENIHKDNILHQSIVPARISLEAEEMARKIALQLAGSMNLIGTLAVEMFLKEDDSIIINELAPRPHNSGHYTMEACETSQFEQHVRAVCNWQLGRTDLMRPVIMTNILGEHLDTLLNKIPTLPDWKIHLYGKAEAKEKRKMGHVNLMRENVETAMMEVRESGIW